MASDIIISGIFSFREITAIKTIRIIISEIINSIEFLPMKIP